MVICHVPYVGITRIRFMGIISARCIDPRGFRLRAGRLFSVLRHPLQNDGKDNQSFHDTKFCGGNSCLFSHSSRIVSASGMTVRCGFAGDISCFAILSAPVLGVSGGYLGGKEGVAWG